MLPLLIVLGYLIGSVPFAYLLTRRLAGIDLRTKGSGNVGAANVLRTAGVRTAMAVVGLDIAKGGLAVGLSKVLDSDPTGAVAAGIAAIIGHIYPVWIGFRGGKGVATACGVFGVLAPLPTVVAAVVFVCTVWWTRYVSLGSLVASAALAPLAYLARVPLSTVVGAVCAALLIFERHRGNLSRLRAGTERRFGQRV